MEMLAKIRLAAGRRMLRLHRKGVRARDNRGNTLVEYALLLALIAVVATGSLALLGNAVKNTVNNVGLQLALGNTVNVQLPFPTIGVSAPAAEFQGGSIAAGGITATVTGQASNAGGTISVYIFGPSVTAPSVCTSGGTLVYSTGVSGSVHSYSTTSAYSVPPAGTYWWLAVYSGDSNDNGTNSGCGGAMPSTVVSMASPTLSVSIAQASYPAYTNVPDSSITAKLTGSTNGNPKATGTINFEVIGPQAAAPATCASGGSPEGSATVNNDGTYTTNVSGGWTPTQLGNYWWGASYTGDANNNTANSGCVEVKVTEAQPTLTLSVLANDAVNAQIPNEDITATLGNAATGAGGRITFKVYGPSASASCTGNGTVVGGNNGVTINGNGSYNPPDGPFGFYEYTPTQTGNYWWVATYSGDGNDLPVSTTCGATGTETVVGNHGYPTITVSAPATDYLGNPIEPVYAILAGATTTARGPLTLTVFGPQSSAPTSCTTGGNTVYNTNNVNGDGDYPNPYFQNGYQPTGVGDYWFYATYGGDANNNSANSGCGGTMVETVVTIPTPTLQWVYAPDQDSTGTNIPAGEFDIYADSSEPMTANFTFTAFYTGASATPPSTCTGGTTIGTVPGGGAENNIYSPNGNGFTPTSAGNYWLYASYAGDTNNNPANTGCGSSLQQLVVANATPTVQVYNQTNPGSTASPITASVHFNNASGSATGTITFTIFGPSTTAPTTCTSGGSAAGSATVNGSGNYTGGTYQATQTGDYWWYANYPGDTDDSAAHSTCGGGMPESVVKLPSNFTIQETPSSPATVQYGTSVTFQVASGLTAAETGTVTYSVQGQGTLCTAAVATSYICGYTDSEYGPGTYLAPGNTYTVIGTYSGNGQYDGSQATNTLSLTISPEQLNWQIEVDGSTTGDTIGVGNQAALTENLPYDATGTVKFYLNGTQVCSFNAAYYDGCYTGAMNTAGSYTVTATYTSTNPLYASNSASNQPVLTVKYAPNLSVVNATGTVTIGQTITASAQLSGASNTATGAITWTVFGPQNNAPNNCTGGSAAGTGTANGNNVVTGGTFVPTAAGDYWWYATYAGDTNDEAATSACGRFAGMAESVVNKANAPAFTISVNGGASATVNYGATVTFAITGLPGSVTPTPTGTVTISSGATTFCTITLPATSCTSVAPGGTYSNSVGGAYSGDTNYNNSNSTNHVTLTVNPVAPSNMTVTGQLTTCGGNPCIAYTATVTGVSGGATPTGTVTFTITANTGGPPTYCTATGNGKTANLNGGGIATCNAYNVNNTHTYTAQATYNGDNNYTTKTASSGAVTG